MVLARIVRFHFKKGKREESFADLDLILNNQARNARGFRGFISLLSKNSENEAVILTLWTDERSLLASETEILSFAVAKILNALEKEPVVEHFGVFSTAMFLREI